MSNAALESLSCGTPIIATASSGGISELAKEANIGDVIVVDDEDLFKIEMSAAVKKNINQLPRQSMLPKNYRLDKVVLQIEEWLNE
jgi:glycosyltransferase involved in cell wall biosynthesis